ncbi:M14 family zinc carboxypeptidase [Schlesneria sp.]|uniref:M14 family zinc carboxypeptidase n=1 Tax=Schlesneria sp. TaxID=2762018 RepID=UPI002EE3FB05
MRTLMTLATLSAATAGYFYLQGTPSVGEPYEAPSAAARLQEEAQREYLRLSEVSRGSVKELVNRVHLHTKSVLDDFANQHGGHSDAPLDDAFQRLRQVTQSAIDTYAADKTPAEEVAKSKPTRLPPTRLDDLQRIAFDPGAAIDQVVEQILIQHEESIQQEEAANIAASSPAAEAESVQTEALKTEKEPEPAPVATVAQQAQEAPAAVPQVAQSGPAESAAEAPAVTGSEITNVSRQEATPVVKTMTAPAQPATAPQASKPIVGYEWKVIGKTTEGRKMHSTQFGSTGTRILVIAGLNGEDRVAVRWLELLADAMASRPDLTKNIEVVFFRAGNPDGLVRKVKTNSRGVPLNRNFPSRGYRQVVGVPSFAVPASEVETRVILDTLYTFRPRRVIHLTSTTGPSQVLYNRSGKPLALELERNAKLKPVLLDPELSPGSLEDFSDGTLEAAVLSLKVSIGNDWQQAWTQVQSQVLAAVVGRPLGAGEGENGVDPDANGSPVPYSTIEPISRNPRNRGYQELPAPPE